MSEKSVNEVVADNLAYYMDRQGLNQQGLAEKSGVAQRTISNYLHPENRQASATGKEPSAKLTELSRLADALSIGVWELVRPMTPKEREFYKQVEKAYGDLMEATEQARANAPPPPTREQLIDDTQRKRKARNH